MTDRAPYSRIYHSIVDDPKFATIYDDDRRLATWLRLLIVAEQAHPASANIPTGTHRASVVALANVGLLDLGTGSRFRIHGLDAERSRRSEAARVGGLASGRSRSAEHSLNERSQSAGTKSNLDEQSKAETRQDEQSIARAGLPNLDPVSLNALERRTGHVASQAGERQLSEYDRLVGDHGLAPVLAAFDAVSGGNRMSARQLVWGAVKVLEPFVEPVRADPATERQAERDNGLQRRLDKTQAYIRDLKAVGETS